MVGRKRRDIPTPLGRGRVRFEAWRRTRKVGTRNPERLWSLAVKLSDAHGLNRTALVLRLDYDSLKKRVGSTNSRASSLTGAFVELPGPSLAAAGEWMIEFEDGAGASMRVHLRGCDAPDLVALGRSFWSGE
jgi:hypothetical protein